MSRKRDEGCCYSGLQRVVAVVRVRWHCNAVGGFIRGLLAEPLGTSRRNKGQKGRRGGGGGEGRKEAQAGPVAKRKKISSRNRSERVANVRGESTREKEKIKQAKVERDREFGRVRVFLWTRSGLLREYTIRTVLWSVNKDEDGKNYVGKTMWKDGKNYVGKTMWNEDGKTMCEKLCEKKMGKTMWEKLCGMKIRRTMWGKLCEKKMGKTMWEKLCGKMGKTMWEKLCEKKMGKTMWEKLCGKKMGKTM
ncbi:hypothetical protein P5V15_015911 [Pogonomyrmex californicus]